MGSSRSWAADQEEEERHQRWVIENKELIERVQKKIAGINLLEHKINIVKCIEFLDNDVPMNKTQRDKIRDLKKSVVAIFGV